MDRWKKVLQIFLYGVFSFYMLGAIWVIFLRNIGLPAPNVRNINFLPLVEPIRLMREGLAGNGQSMRNLNQYSYNIALFIPSGIYMMLFRKNKNMWLSLLLVFLISFGVEIIQYVFAIGRSDVDDLIMNTFGGFIGILIYVIAIKSLKSEEKVRRAMTVLSAAVGIPVLVIVILLVVVNFFG